MEKTIEGKGKFKYKDELEIEGSIRISVDSNNAWDSKKNSVICYIDEGTIDKTLNDLPFFPWIFEGESIEGELISANNMALTKRGGDINNQGLNIKWEFDISELVIEGNSKCERFEFWISNFLIAFDDMTRIGTRSVRNKSSFTINHNQDTIKIDFFEVNNIVTEKDEIIKKNEDLVTLKVVLKKENSTIQFDEAREIMESIIDLFSVAYGARVNWTNALGFNNDLELFNMIRNVPHASLTPFRQLIRVLYPGYLSRFIQMCYPVYNGLGQETRHSLKKLVEGIHLSASRLIFPAPFIILGSSIEDFANNELGDTSTHYIKRAERRRIYPYFKGFIDENIVVSLSEEDIGDFDETGIKQKLSGLVQRNLRSRITNLLQTFEVEFDNDWVRQFVIKRNQAAHGDYVFTPSDYLIWTRMATLLEQIILIKLQYSDEYLDWSTSPPEWKINLNRLG
ncbi:hypothetical protein [Lysinibacillus sp. LZ02]|uniref:hypothetical protein n=1 Tax=Lysinibacillus sp. LZ02 TaxID=3420668 RepID=UPI003D367A14